MLPSSGRWCPWSLSWAKGDARLSSNILDLRFMPVCVETHNGCWCLKIVCRTNKNDFLLGVTEMIYLVFIAKINNCRIIFRFWNFYTSGTIHFLTPVLNWQKLIYFNFLKYYFATVGTMWNCIEMIVYQCIYIQRVPKKGTNSILARNNLTICVPEKLKNIPSILSWHYVMMT